MLTLTWRIICLHCVSLQGKSRVVAEDIFNPLLTLPRKITKFNMIWGRGKNMYSVSKIHKPCHPVVKNDNSLIVVGLFFHFQFFIQGLYYPVPINVSQEQSLHHVFVIKNELTSRKWSCHWMNPTTYSPALMSFDLSVGLTRGLPGFILRGLVGVFPPVEDAPVPVDMKWAKSSVCLRRNSKRFPLSATCDTETEVQVLSSITWWKDICFAGMKVTILKKMKCSNWCHLIKALLKPWNHGKTWNFHPWFCKLASTE